MAIVTGRGKRAIEDHFDISYELEHQIKGTSKEPLLNEIRGLIDRCTFTYTRQKSMKGLGDAILAGESLIGNETFAVILADDLAYNPEGKGILSQMVEIYKKYPNYAIVAVEEINIKDSFKYGIVKAKKIEKNLFDVSFMVEKPSPKNAPSNLAIIGRYILIPEIFDKIRATNSGVGGEIQLTDALNELAKDGKVLAYKFKGKRFDCGTIDGFVEAINYFYRKGLK